MPIANLSIFYLLMDAYYVNLYHALRQLCCTWHPSSSDSFNQIDGFIMLRWTMHKIQITGITLHLLSISFSFNVSIVYLTIVCGLKQDTSHRADLWDEWVVATHSPESIEDSKIVIKQMQIPL